MSNFKENSTTAQIVGYNAEKSARLKRRPWYMRTISDLKESVRNNLTSLKEASELDDLSHLSAQQKLELLSSAFGADGADVLTGVLKKFRKIKDKIEVQKEVEQNPKFLTLNPEEIQDDRVKNLLLKAKKDRELWESPPTDQEIKMLQSIDFDPYKLSPQSIDFAVKYAIKNARVPFFQIKQAAPELADKIKQIFFQRTGEKISGSTDDWSLMPDEIRGEVKNLILSGSVKAKLPGLQKTLVKAKGLQSPKMKIKDRIVKKVGSLGDVQGKPVHLTSLADIEKELGKDEEGVRPGDAIKSLRGSYQKILRSKLPLIIDRMSQKFDVDFSQLLDRWNEAAETGEIKEPFSDTEKKAIKFWEDNIEPLLFGSDPEGKLVSKKTSKDEPLQFTRIERALGDIAKSSFEQMGHKLKEKEFTVPSFITDDALTVARIRLNLTDKDILQRIKTDEDLANKLGRLSSTEEDRTQYAKSKIASLRKENPTAFRKLWKAVINELLQMGLKDSAQKEIGAEKKRREAATIMGRKYGSFSKMKSKEKPFTKFLSTLGMDINTFKTLSSQHKKDVIAQFKQSKEGLEVPDEKKDVATDYPAHEYGEEGKISSELGILAKRLGLDVEDEEGEYRQRNKELMKKLGGFDPDKIEKPKDLKRELIKKHALDYVQQAERDLEKSEREKKEVENPKVQALLKKMSSKKPEEKFDKTLASLKAKKSFAQPETSMPRTAEKSSRGMGEIKSIRDLLNDLDRIGFRWGFLLRGQKDKLIDALGWNVSAQQIPKSWKDWKSLIPPIGAAKADPERIKNLQKVVKNIHKFASIVTKEFKDDPRFQDVFRSKSLRAPKKEKEVQKKPSGKKGYLEPDVDPETKTVDFSKKKKQQAVPRGEKPGAIKTKDIAQRFKSKEREERYKRPKEFQKPQQTAGTRKTQRGEPPVKKIKKESLTLESLFNIDGKEEKVEPEKKGKKGWEASALADKKDFVPDFEEETKKKKKCPQDIDFKKIFSWRTTEDK